MDGDEACHSLVSGLQAQADLLMRRVQRLQVRMCQRHLHKHIQSFVRQEQSSSGLGCQMRKVRDNSAHSNGRIPHKSPDRFLERDRMTPTSALADIVRSWDSSAADSCRLSDEPVNRSAGVTDTKRLPVDRTNAQCVQRSAGQLQANLLHLEEDYDSDATDSSSGGESGDDGFCESATSAFPSSKKQFSAKVRDSTAWTWASERAAIASRWMWLIAQVADLEFKIRQQNEMYRQLREEKGPITLENRSADGTDGCVRTMSLHGLKKRKLVRASGALSAAVRKIARYSTIQCSCSSLSNFVSPCVLCNGRFGYVQVIDTDSMPQCERIAILDPACHPVLTLPSQIPLGLHFSKFLKKETVQKSIGVKKVNKSSVSSNNKKAGISSLPESPGKYLKDIRRSNHKKSNALISSNKLKKKYESSSKRKYPHSHFDYSSSGKKSKTGRERHESSSNASNESCRPDSPIQSPLPPENSALRRRRSEYAYDINNIVIPYSIASTTRVEKLQYKEILTPKWREIADLVKAEAAHSDEDEVEDLSDSAFTERHLKCEKEEKNRFLSFVAPNAASGGSGPKRARTGRLRYDSKCDATTVTGNNGYGNHNEDCNSQDSEISNHTSINNMGGVVQNNHSKDANQELHGTPARAFERRRTTSSSRTREDSVDDDHMPDVQPFEKRLFPLAPADVDDLVSDAEELDVNGKHEQTNGSCPESPLKTVLANHTSDSLPASEPATPHSAQPIGLLYASSSGETDHEEEDPEWEPKEQP